MLAAILSALLFAFSFPKFSIFIFGFVYFIPLLYQLEKKKKTGFKYPFFLFFLFSLVSYPIILYWIPNVMVKYGGADLPISIVGLIALSLFLSIFHGLAGVLINKIINSSRSLLTILFMIPVTWIAKDLVVERIFGGFPWCLTGYSQYKNIYFVQVAEFGGIHLITFVMILMNILLYRLLRYRDKKAFIALFVCFVAVYTTGYYLYNSSESAVSKLETHQAGIVQPNVSNDPISYEAREKLLENLLDVSRDLARKGAEFVVWPEHSVDLYPLQNQEHFDGLMNYVRANVPLLAGFTDMQGTNGIYNSAFLFKKDSFDKYDKVHLTPFGEYILFREVLFFVKRITDEIADFTPGKELKNLNFNGNPISTPICYEVIFPELVRDFVAGENGGRLIVTISNDSWFGNTSAPYQHLAMAVFRSIENRRYILRSTSNGISGIVSPTGEILYQSSYQKSDQFIAPFKFISTRTVFNRIGYLFPYFCVLLVFIHFSILFFKRKK